MITFGENRKLGMSPLLLAMLGLACFGCNQRPGNTDTGVLTRHKEIMSGGDHRTETETSRVAALWLCKNRFEITAWHDWLYGVIEILLDRKLLLSAYNWVAKCTKVTEGSCHSTFTRAGSRWELKVHCENGVFQSIKIARTPGSLRFEGVSRRLKLNLYEAVKLIHFSPLPYHSDFNPAALIAAVNGLHALGKEKALHALQSYSRMARDDSWRGYGFCSDRILPIVGLLFISDDGQELAVKSMNLGSGGRDVNIPPPHPWHNGLIMVDDIPFMFVPNIEESGVHIGGGPMPDPDKFMEKLIERGCRFRKAPLRPKGDPYDASRAIFKSHNWKLLIEFNNDKEEELKQMITDQAKRAQVKWRQ